ncbi:HEPN domain-containing protein [Thermodesulfobium sp.]|jgi:uncharacterized protein (UPF0332 family)
MDFDWKDYIKLAQKLYIESNKDSIEEAYNRSVISRSYYGIFCISRIKAGLESYKPSKETDPGTHKKVISYYKSSNKLDEKELGKILDELRKWRNDADYEGRKGIDKNAAERAILKANEALKLLGENLN